MSLSGNGQSLFERSGMEKKQSSEISARTETIIAIVGLVLMLSFWSGIIYLIYEYGYLVFEYVTGTRRSIWFRVAGVFLILIFGYILYLFRQDYRKQYGLVEISAGLVAGWVGIGKFESAGISEAIAVVAAMYFVVRGIDNYKIGQGYLLPNSLRRGITLKKSL